jgi:hypothetical protein
MFEIWCSGNDLKRAQQWLTASALGREPKPTTLHVSFITARFDVSCYIVVFVKLLTAICAIFSSRYSQALDASMQKRKLIAIFFWFIVAISVIWVCACHVHAVI